MEARAPYFNKVPPELQEYPNWVCGDLDKVPFDPKTGKKAMANVPGTWGTLPQATTYLEDHKGNGIRTLGFEMSESPFTGVDFDHCRNPESGVIDSWVMEIIKALDSYTEISPSGTGIRIFVTAGDDFPLINRKKGGLGDSGTGAIEIANTGKYFSVTGNHLEGTPDWIGHRPEELQKVYNKYFPAKAAELKPSAKTHPNVADDEILQKAGKAKNGPAFRKLFSGDFSNYPSQSEADQALCSMLAYWTVNDPLQIDSLFRQSGLYREKWEREDYRTQTINRAIEITIEVYKEKKTEPEEPTPENKVPKTSLVMDLFEGFPVSWFSNHEIREQTGLDAADVRDILRRKRDSGILTTDGKKHRLTPPSRIVNPFEIMAGAFDLEFPLSLHDYAIISQGDVAVVSGWKNCGKTAFLMDTGLLNSQKGLEVNYCVTENVQKIGRRYLQWGYTEEQIKARITFRDCRDRDYAGIIQRDCLNILDYYNPANGEYHRTAADIEAMARNLGKGVLIIGIQHAHGAAMPRGGELSQELSQLSIILSEVENIRTGEIEGRKTGRARILTIKEPGTRKGGEGKVCQYEITAKGGRLSQVDTWNYPKKS